jgi:hypothetical protein
MIVWKVVRKETRKSACISGQLARVYEQGKTVESLDSSLPLFAFNTRLDAEDFISRINEDHTIPFIIIKCEATISSIKLYRILCGVLCPEYQDISIETLLCLLTKSYNTMDVSTYPGVVQCSSITPLE